MVEVGNNIKIKGTMKIFLLIVALFFPLGLLAQHLTFEGVELGENTEVIKYELKKKGFEEVIYKGTEQLKGKFLQSNCLIYIHEKNNQFEYLHIEYRFDEDFSESKANSIAEGVATIISKELSLKGIKHKVSKNVPLWGSVSGTRISLKNGWYEIMADGSVTDYQHNWSVIVRVWDYPDNPLFTM